MKLLTIAALLVIVSYAIIFKNENHNLDPTEKKSTSPVPQTVTKEIYRPEDVTELTWSYDGGKIKVKRSGEHWRASSSFRRQPIDDWNIQRRVIVFSKVPLKQGVGVTNPMGEIEIATPSAKFHGIYNQDSFIWSNGGIKDQGFLFSENPDVKTIVDEGLWGFRPHTLKICDQRKIKQIYFKDWSLEKKSNQWNVMEKENRTMAKEVEVANLSRSLCEFTVDNFVEKVKSPMSSSVVTIKSGTQEIDIKNENDIFFITGIAAGIKSHALAEAIKITSLDKLKDPSLKEAKIAVDHSASNDDRLGAIRKLRGNRSPEALAALRSIVFEKTDIDLFRYEAVDSLASIGTKEAYKIIAQRLAQVGRSGFELRLARALAPALGMIFNADEKTPESIRRPEVDALIKASAAHPPGK